MQNWNIPFLRNPFFTGREDELAQLHRQLQQGRSAAVGQAQSISGLGGVGKTQLAVEYAYRHRGEYHAVLWANTESTEALISSFSEIARLLELPEKDAKEEAITVGAVKGWLQRQPGWLLILDNADAPALLRDYLPTPLSGHLLLTTRAADVSAALAGLAHPVVVETFTEEQATLFLLHRSGLLALDAPLDQATDEDRQCARAIAQELGYLPLALDQVGAYLATTRCGLSAYQQISQRHRAKLLAERRGAEHPEPVATTWNISFRRVEQQNPAAADLLRLCAFLAPEAIPEMILTAGGEALGPLLKPLATDQYLFNEAIESLRAYSLLSRDPRRQDLTVHRLVQAVVRESLSREQQQQWMQRAIHAVAAACPGVEFANWSVMERLLPHALTCAAWIESMLIPPLAAADLLNQTGSYLHERARYSEAEPLYRRALAICEQHLGQAHPATATSLNNLALLYSDQGRYEEAEPLYRRALAIDEQHLGQAHPDTAASLNNLAGLYQAQGRYEEAEPLFQRALAIDEQHLGQAHPHTATSFNNLAGLYRAQGRYEEAEPLYQRALAIREQHLGQAHPDTAASLNNLATLYSDQGRYEEAEPLYQRALSICEQHLGQAHPHTASSLNNLAGLYQAQGRYEEAEPLYQRALAIREQHLGQAHPFTASSLNNLAALYDDQGRYEEAEPLYRRALAIREQHLGQAHPATATSLNNLAALYRAQGRYEEAEPLLQRALSIFEQRLGRDHPRTQQIMRNYQALLSEMHRG